MKISKAARLVFWVAVIVATGFLVRAESGEKRASMPNTRNTPPLRILDQNGRPAVSGVPSATGTIVDVSGGGGCSWSAGPDLPSPGVRFVGVFFPANGKFYVMGGRAFDGGGGEFINPFEYDPVSNSWTTKSAAYADNQVSNMGCAVLNDSGTDYIYCVGGSESATSTTTGRVFRYDPVADSITTIPSNWPPGDQNVLPGGFSVFDNKLYILGGFNINVSMDDRIYEFTPNPAAWVQKTAVLPVPRGYIPTATIGNFIYTAGGSMFDPVEILVPTTDSFKYDPTADSITTIASIPRATDNTRGLNFCSQLWVIAGDDTTFPNPSNQVNIYDPLSDTWSLGDPIATARRNFATDTDGNTHIWLGGGYDANIAPIASMEIFACAVSPCGSPSPTPTATATATSTPSGTPTATATATATGTPPPTATPCEGRCTPTPRPRPTPAPRP